MSSSDQSSYARSGMSPDLSNGVIIVLSGGGFDGMNPVEVRDRMDEYITSVNADPFVQGATGGLGLRFQLLSGQTTKHLHQAQWRDICAALSLLPASPLIVVGHSNGGAAAMDLARCLADQGKTVDLLISADSVLTLDDIGDINKVPDNVDFNLNPYVIPTPAWILAPFPIGKKNKRQSDNSYENILNVGLEYNLPGALAHRNAFYDLAGGDKKPDGTYTFPSLFFECTLAKLKGQSNDDIIALAIPLLQTLATGADVEIKLRSKNLNQTLHP
jgi:hypothetical protein